MLTAAVCGDIFTSPPVDSILAVRSLFVCSKLMVGMGVYRPLLHFLNKMLQRTFVVLFAGREIGSCYFLCRLTISDLISGNSSCDWSTGVSLDCQGIAIPKLLNNDININCFVAHYIWWYVGGCCL